MAAESRAFPDALAVVEELAATGAGTCWRRSTTSRVELNQARIERFNLGRYFSAFFSSGFLGVKKPDQAIYRLALQITQRNSAASASSSTIET